MKADRNYTLMVMRDDGQTRRMRMGQGFYRFLLSLLVLVPLLLGGSLWLSYNLWKQNMLLFSQQSAIQETLLVAGSELERLDNLRSFLRKNDPQSLYDILHPQRGSVTVQADALDNNLAASSFERLIQAMKGMDVSSTPQKAPDQSLVEAESPPLAESLSLGEVAGADAPQGTALHPVALPAQDRQPNAKDTVPQTPLAQEAEELPDQPLNPDEVFSEAVRVENLMVRRVGTSGLRISFDLYNTELQSQIAGDTKFDLILPDGSIHSLAPNGDTSFRIKRLKKIVGNPVLPKNLQNIAGTQVRVSLESNGTVVYRTLMPLPN